MQTGREIGPRIRPTRSSEQTGASHAWFAGLHQGADRARMKSSNADKVCLAAPTG
jgi:hypothetical protein